MPEHPVAIVTGASRGLGRALAAGLAARGLAGGHRRPRRRRAGRRPRRDLPAEVGSRSPGDVTDPAHRAALVGRRRGPAGSTCSSTTPASSGPSPQPPLADYPLAALREVYEVNVRRAAGADPAGAAVAARRAAAAVVNVSSDAAVEPYPGWGGYGSAKAALDQARRACSRVEEPALRVWRGRPGRPADPDAPGGVPRRGHLATGRCRRRVVPAFLRLLADRPPAAGTGLRLSPAVASCTPPVAA